MVLQPEFLIDEYHRNLRCVSLYFPNLILSEKFNHIVSNCDVLSQDYSNDRYRWISEHDMNL